MEKRGTKTNSTLLNEMNNKNKEERVAIFIDGSNLYNSLKKINIRRLDFQKLIDKLTKNRKLVEVFYYIAPLDIKFNEERYWKHQRFLDKLRNIPNFNIILCNLKKVVRENKEFHFEVKGDDIHLAVDLVSGAYEDLYDTAIIVSGDEDFVSAIEKVRKLSKKVENAYFHSSSSDALRINCNSSNNLNNLIKNISLE